MAALKREFNARPTVIVAGIIGILGAIATVIGFVLEPTRAFAAYLAAWCAVALIVFGALSVQVIFYAANSQWPAAVRRLCDAVAGGVIPIAILAIPLLIGIGYAWPWATDRHTEAVAVKHVYLSVPFFIVRFVIYLVAFAVPAELLRRWSLRRDEHPVPPSPPTVDVLRAERRLSSAMIPVFGLVLTFAAFDWLMSLYPSWWSSAFGLYILTDALRAGLAIVVILAWRGVASGQMPLATGVFHSLGRVLHAFVILWTYIAYFQAMLIQIANKPNEAQFYVDRSTDGWRFVTALLIVLGFALPFPLLIPRRLKRRPAYIGAIAIMVIVAHYIDMWWLVMPRIEAIPIPSWTDLAAICALGGLTTAACAWRMRGVPLLAIGDPYLPAALAYETHT